MPPKPPRYPAERWKDAKEFWEAGTPAPAIARVTGFPVSAIWQRASREGWDAHNDRRVGDEDQWTRAKTMWCETLEPVSAIVMATGLSRHQIRRAGEEWGARPELGEGRTVRRTTEGMPAPEQCKRRCGGCAGVSRGTRCQWCGRPLALPKQYVA